MNNSHREALDHYFQSQAEDKVITWDQDSSHHHPGTLRQFLQNVDPSLHTRLIAEIEGLGPIDSLLKDSTISEILVNQHDQVFYEKNGKLLHSTDYFYNEKSYDHCIEKLCQLCRSFLNHEKPYLEMQYQNFRITIILKDLARGHHLLSIRKKIILRRSLAHLYEMSWCNLNQLDILRNIIKERKNFLVVGGTSSGKTTALQSMMEELSPDERLVLIEDTQELELPNTKSVSLLTRTQNSDTKYDIQMADLLKRALRLRPDRVAIGEIRGPEAKDLLMALSTGHEGSFGSLHANNEHEALLRLEMLVQMGAPQWSIESIRRLIGLVIHYVIVIHRDSQGNRRLKSIHKLETVEKTGFTFSNCDLQ